ncbi:hypothetical protein BDU57DRAFT_586994 [Ampelomyces quisqualis]|uniref:Uncharacterized protein n=1 Tax=Ampelomyces quisqualis TaxID=50730 RepID=A0A6A5QM87_AMPQU|nr:hypothetical protein BDU57DRAFT_586994 [Ampelomyces quisqualis]
MTSRRHYFIALSQILLISGTTVASNATSALEGGLNPCILESDSLLYDTSSKLRVRKWVQQPNYRGTFDILWVSLVTIGISTHTMLCLNLPAPKESYLNLVPRRILWMLLGIIGPEFVLTYAAGQWSKTKWSVIAFQDKHPEWHMRHAFFADMGGFVLHTGDGTIFPLNATQLHWLVRHDYVAFPNITRRDMWDKSKQDTFTKFITAFQVGYLIIQCSARAGQKLTIKTLELNALAIVTVADMIGNREWDLIPLDHVDPNGPAYSVNVQPFMHMPYLFCFATLLFTGIHVVGWNFDFPVELERLLWRISSLLLFGITIALWFFETIASWTRLVRWRMIYLYMFNKEDIEKHRRNMTSRQTLQPKRRMSELPLAWNPRPSSFAELRDINASAYVTVEWTDFIPHV